MENATNSKKPSLLGILRSNPEEAFKNYAFVIDSEHLTYTGEDIKEEGGCYVLGGFACTISEFTEDVDCVDWNKNSKKITLVHLKPTRIKDNEEFPDFYFPWVVNDGGVGMLEVKQLPDEETIYVTPGMDGCALQINLSNETFYFFHDQGGESMKCKRNNNGEGPSGKLCYCNVNSNDADKLIDDELFPCDFEDKTSPYNNRCFLNGKGNQIFRIDKSVYDDEYGFMEFCNSRKTNETICVNLRNTTFISIFNGVGWDIYASQYCIVGTIGVKESEKPIVYLRNGYDKPVVRVNRDGSTE